MDNMELWLTPLLILPGVSLLIVSGILCLLYASRELVRESILSLEIIEEHLKEVGF